MSARTNYKQPERNNLKIYLFKYNALDVSMNEHETYYIIRIWHMYDYNYLYCYITPVFTMHTSCLISVLYINNNIK